MTFEKWLWRVADSAMESGLVTVADIQRLCESVKKEAYEAGYKKGKNDGYSMAVRDIEEES